MRKFLLSMVVLTCTIKENASAQYWSALGKGIGHLYTYNYCDGGCDGYDTPVTGPPIAAMCIYNGELYAAGFFDHLPDTGGHANNIAKWNGSKWQPVPGFYTLGGGGFDSWVNALLVYNGELYVAGRFTNAGNIEANNIAKWNGTEWSSVGAGLGTYGYGVSSLAIYNGELYAGGHFYNSGGLALNNIAKWNGTNWSAVGSGIDVYTEYFPYGTVSSLVVHKGELYAGGNFDTASVNTPSNIVKWNGTDWSGVGTDLNEIIFSLASYNGELYAGGNFINIKKLDGNNWTPLGPAIDGTVISLTIYNGSLIAGGYIDSAGSIAAKNIAKWDGTNWTAMGYGISSGVLCMTTHDNVLYAGGNFNTAGNVLANRVAAWREQCNSIPDQPGHIKVNGSACIGRHVTYYIDPEIDAADFTWTLPPGWQGTSITNQIVALTGTSGGTISVTANNPCGSSTPQTLVANIIATPLIGNIKGNLFVYTGQKENYSIDQVIGFTGSYTWTLNSGGIIFDGQYTSSISINWHDVGEYVLTVNANNICGSISQQKITIKVMDASASNPFEVKTLPNPSQGEFYIKAKQVQDKWIQVEVFNSTGQLVFRSGRKKGANDYSQRIDLDKMQYGIYLLKIMIDDKVYVRQIAIIH